MSRVTVSQPERRVQNRVFIQVDTVSGVPGPLPVWQGTSVEPEEGQGPRGAH